MSLNFWANTKTSRITEFSELTFLFTPCISALAVSTEFWTLYEKGSWCSSFKQDTYITVRRSRSLLLFMNIHEFYCPLLTLAWAYSFVTTSDFNYAMHFFFETPCKALACYFTWQELCGIWFCSFLLQWTLADTNEVVLLHPGIWLLVGMQIKYVKQLKFFYIFKEFCAAPYIIWKMCSGLLKHPRL